MVRIETQVRMRMEVMLMMVVEMMRMMMEMMRMMMVEMMRMMVEIIMVEEMIMRRRRKTASICTVHTIARPRVMRFTYTNPFKPRNNLTR